MQALADMLVTAQRAAATKPSKSSTRRKLTMAEADDVRKLHKRGVSISDLSAQYGLNPNGIRGIIEGRYYTTPDRPATAPIKGKVTWQHPDVSLPDADIEVLVALDDGDVIPAFRDADCWRDLTAVPLRDGAVLMWCEYPDHPMPPKGV